MYLDYFLNKKLLLLLLVSFTFTQQQDITLELLQQVQDKIDSLEQSQGDCQANLNNANQRLADAVDQEALDATNAINSINNLNGQINDIGSDVINLNGRVTGLENRVTELEGVLTESLQRISKLENINAIWKANFKVVNSTFTLLRNKLKIIIPVIRFPVFVFPPANPANSQNGKKKKPKGKKAK